MSCHRIKSCDTDHADPHEMCPQLTPVELPEGVSLDLFQYSCHLTSLCQNSLSSAGHHGLKMRTDLWVWKRFVGQMKSNFKLFESDGGENAIRWLVQIFWVIAIVISKSEVIYWFRQKFLMFTSRARRTVFIENQARDFHSYMWMWGFQILKLSISTMVWILGFGHRFQYYWTHIRSGSAELLRGQIMLEKNDDFTRSKTRCSNVSSLTSGFCPTLPINYRR